MKLCEEHLKLSCSVILVLIHFSSCAVLSYYRINNEPGLYTPQDDVTILTIDNFNNSYTNIYGSKRAWLVEFYSNWCGFCQRAAPRYKAFATDVKGWNDVVVVAALDCANEKSAPVCEYFKITRYPTFRYIHENYVEDPNNTGLIIVADSHTNYTEHRNNLLSIMRQEQIEGRGKMFPNLQPFNNSELCWMFPRGDFHLKLGFLIVQEPDDTVGAAVAMDFHKLREVVVRYTYDEDILLTFDTLPALYKVEKNGKAEPVQLVSADRQGIKHAINKILMARNINVPEEILRNYTVKEAEIVPTSDPKDIELRTKIKEMGDVVFQLDLENAVRYSLKREIGGAGEIKGEKLEAVRKYINVLVQYFPFGSKGKNLLKKIQEYVNSGPVINGAEINQMVKEAEEPDQEVFSGPQNWLGCRGSTLTRRGFPCSMWKLFHYLTVNAAFDPKNTQDSNPRVVLEAMHGYIKLFFGCEDCSEHFQEMAKRREIFKVVSWEESVLWLWRAHNEVNQRLHGDPTEDPEYPKVQFPTREQCSSCKTPDGSWNEVEVLNYLKRMYSSNNIKYFGTDPVISHLNMPSRASLMAASGLAIMLLIMTVV